MKLNNSSFFLLLCIGISLFVSSCKKDNAATSQPQLFQGVHSRIKTETGSNSSNNYFYDDKGRQIKRTSSYGLRYEYSYTDTSIVLVTYNATSPIDTAIYKLDTVTGLVTKWTDVYPGSFDTYTYNSNKQILTDQKTTVYPNNTNTKSEYRYFYNSSNNLDSIVDNHDIGTASSGTYVYHYDEYYTDKINTTGNENFGQLFFGKSSNNLLKTYRITNNAGVTTSYNYDYTFDSQNRVIKEVVTQIGTTTRYETTYTYY
ncbi:MAG: hypothetical protein ACM3H8_16760 [Sphingobacteriales bacterium]